MRLVRGAFFCFGGFMQYTKEELNEFSLYSLRALGRKTGVKAPSSLRKKELIENILDVQSGKTPPHATKRGRPALPKQVEPSLEEMKIIIKKIVEDGREKLQEDLREIGKKLLKEVLEYNPPSKDKK